MLEEFVRMWSIRVAEFSVILVGFVTICKKPNEQSIQRLKELLEPLKCKILILDNPLRYARCCTFHKKRLKGLPKFLAMQNRVLAQNFGSKVLNHKKYLGLPTKKAYDQKIYQKLFSDSVHFKKNVYDSLVQWVAKREKAPID